METLEKHVDPLTQDDVLDLLQRDVSPRVSIYLPTERAWNKSKRNPTRLKNQLSAAAQQLEARGLDAREIEDLLAPAKQLIDGPSSFWQHQSDGLALFLAPNQMDTYRLPMRFEERVVVGGLFHVRPLLPYLDHGSRFYILALDRSGVHLYRCNRHALEETDLPEDVATSLPEDVEAFDFEALLNYHTGSAGTDGRGDAIFHGQGDAGDKAEIKKRIEQFFRSLDNGVRAVLSADASPAPLVVAGTDSLRGLYRVANHYPRLMDKGIERHPSDSTAEDLHEHAWPIVASTFAAAQEQARNDYHQLAASEPQRAPYDLDDVVRAAYYERVDTLFVTPDDQVWGTFDTQDGTVHTDEAPSPANADLLDLAVAHTLLNSGTVYVTDADDIPDEAPVAALLRY